VSRELPLLVGTLLLALAPAGGAPAASDAARADLVVELADSPDPARASPGVRYRVSVANRGPGAAERVTVRLETSFRRAGYEVPRGCFSYPRGIGCTRARLLPRRTWTRVVSVTPCPGRTGTATATVRSRTPDPRPASNVARETTTILPGPPPPPPPGGFGGCP
jgi:hypothetical protein